MSELIHGTAIAVAGRAALLRGPPGAGKSDLALRCLAVQPGPFCRERPCLVADDQVYATLQNGRVILSCPLAIRGLLEVRGVGIVPVDVVDAADLALVVDLVPRDDVERLPQPLPPAMIAGKAVRRVRLHSFEASAPLKLFILLRDATGA